MSVQVSKWTKFFIQAGIPSAPASNYAVIFYDNRIKEDMLPDLTKEILQDMGITVMGDIIAILRHGKQVHAQSEREKSAKDMAATDDPGLSGESSPSNQATAAGTKRKSTAAGRMVDHWINNQKLASGSASPVRDPGSSPSPSKKKLTIQTVVSDKPQPARSQKTLSERFGDKGVKVVSSKLEKVSPKVEGEHTLKVKLPQGSTERSKKLIAKQKQLAASAAVNKAKVIKKQSVFDRLGKESPPLTMTLPEKKKTELKPLKPLKTSVTVKLKEKGQSSVFSRLGELVSPSVQTTVQAVNPRIRLPPDDEPAVIDYTSHSVLQPVKRKEKQPKPVKPVKPVKRTLGLTSDADEKSVFARLGSKV